MRVLRTGRPERRHATSPGLHALPPPDELLTRLVWEDIDDAPTSQTTVRHDLTFSEVGVVTDAAATSRYLAFHVEGSDTLQVAARRPWLVCVGTTHRGVTAAALARDIELRPSDAALELQTSLSPYGPKLLARSVLTGRCAPSALGAILAPDALPSELVPPPLLPAAWAKVTARPWLSWITGDQKPYVYRLGAVLDADGHPMRDLAPLDELRTDNTAAAWQRLSCYTFVVAAETTDSRDAVHLALLGTAVRLVSAATLEHIAGEVQWSLVENWAVSAHDRYPDSLPLPTDTALAMADWHAEFRVRERIGETGFWGYAGAVAMTPIAIVADVSLLAGAVGLIVWMCNDTDDADDRRAARY